MVVDQSRCEGGGQAVASEPGLGLAQAQQVCEQVLCCGKVLLPALVSRGGRHRALCGTMTAGPGWGPLRIGLAGGCVAN